jgi:hypothetical protein
LLRVVAGGVPTDEELVALVVVLAAAPPAASAPPVVRSAWAARDRMLRQPLPHGPGAWQRSGYWGGA